MIKKILENDEALEKAKSIVDDMDWTYVDNFVKSICGFNPRYAISSGVRLVRGSILFNIQGLNIPKGKDLGIFAHVLKDVKFDNFDAWIDIDEQYLGVRPCISYKGNSQTLGQCNYYFKSKKWESRKDI